MVEVLILSGSETDRPIAEKAIEVLNDFKVSNEFIVASAHRNPEKLEEVLKKTNAKVFIAIAGLSAALPGVVASKTTRPVIGVPVNVKLEGLDALLSTMQIPPGIPVATVGIDNGKNAGLLAIQILALNNEKLANELVSYRQKMKK